MCLLPAQEQTREAPESEKRTTGEKEFAPSPHFPRKNAMSLIERDACTEKTLFYLLVACTR
jgi:hypothetical protein